MTFPRLYAIVDIDLLTARSLDLVSFTSQLKTAGVQLLQYRNKQGSARAMLNDSATLRNIFPVGSNLKLILNDRPDLALLSGLDGVHVGQDDLSPEDARKILGPPAWVGVSTHSAAQLIQADRTSCDYIAYGPVFPTVSKQNPDPTVGVAGLKIARGLTRKPLVAIGGITRENYRSVLDAGADSVAVISGLAPRRPDRSTQHIAEEFLALLV